MKKKPQTEAKAKGLVKGVGDYKGKTLNLSKKQLGKAGSAAAAKRTVDISSTRYEGKKVLGPKGKPLTGRVDLGGGNIAVYKDGVRVRAAAKKPSGPPKPKTTTTRVSPSARGEGGRSGNRKATSGTVTSAIAKGKKMGPQKPKGPKNLGRGGYPGAKGPGVRGGR